MIVWGEPGDARPAVVALVRRVVRFFTRARR